jgi:hypothetical protein
MDGRSTAATVHGAGQSTVRLRGGPDLPASILVTDEIDKVIFARPQ